MATKTIDYLHFYVPITTYTYEDREFHTLRVSVRYCKGRGFRASFTPGWGDNYGWGCIIDGSDNPLTAGITVEVEPATKNNSKRIVEMTENLKMAKDVIAALFDDREWEKLKAVLKNAAKFGYTEKFNENNNQNSTIMAQNVKAADLIGKTIVVGNNQGKIIVKSVQDNGMLACEFSKAGEDATTPMTVTLPNLQKMTERGLWKISETESATVVGGVVVAVSEHHDITTEADVAEVEDIVPVVTSKKSDVGSKTADAPQTSCVPAVASEQSSSADIKPQTSAKVKPISKPKQEKPKAKTQPSKDKYVYSTYQTSKGKIGAKITGVSETDAAYQQAAAIHASGSYTKDKDGNKQFYLCFGPRYAEAAKKVCELLNAGKPIEDAIAVVNAATEERAVKKEEGRRKREEYKAQPSKGYSSEDVAAMLRKVLAGGDIPEDIKAILEKAA